MVFGIDAVVSEHFEMFFGDMDDEVFDKVQSGNAFFNGFVVFVSCVVESNKFTVLFIDAGGSNNRAAKVSADVFDSDIRSAKIWFSPDIETFGMIFIDIIFDFSEGGADGISHLFQKNLAKSISKESVVKMFEGTPNSEVTGNAFGNQSMDMRIPFQVTTEGVKDTDKSGSKAFGFICIVEHAKNNISYG